MDDSDVQVNGLSFTVFQQQVGELRCMQDQSNRLL